MCLAVFYILSAVVAASAQDSQWIPYMNLQAAANYQQDQQAACIWQLAAIFLLIYANMQHQASDFSGGYDFNEHGGGGSEGHDFGGHDFGGHDLKAHSYPVHQHIEEENPEPIKHYKEIVVPVHKNVEFKVPHPVLIPVPHPVPIQIPVPKAVVIPVIKEVSIPVEKSVPYPVQREVKVPKIKEVPFEVIKHIIVTVEKPIPFKVPVYETIIHTKKGSHKI